MPHPNEPELEKLKEISEGIKDPKKSDAIQKQIARREAHERAKQESIPRAGSNDSQGN